MQIREANTIIHDNSEFIRILYVYDKYASLCASEIPSMVLQKLANNRELEWRMSRIKITKLHHRRIEMECKHNLLFEDTGRTVQG